MKTDVLLFSGGMDSFIAYHFLGKLDTIYVRLWHKYQEAEVERVMSLIPETLQVDFPLGQFEKADAEIPMRNLYLAMIAVNHGYSHVHLIVQRDEMTIPDRTISFLGSASRLLTSLVGRNILISTPFQNLDKVAMVHWYLKQGLSVSELTSTWACYQRTDEHCGACPACFRRFVAFRLNGIKEDWHNKIFHSEIALLYQERAKSGHYSLKRAQHILEALDV